MTQNPHFSQATSSLACGGGCFSIVLVPPAAALFIGVILLLAFGITTSPNDVLAFREDNLQFPAEDQLAPLFTPEVLNWEPSILVWAVQWDLDPNLVATVMQIESCGDSAALSPSGAIGLFQVMPYHFEDGENAYLPDTNALRGLAYLRLVLETYDGNHSMAFAGYNGGISGAGIRQSLWSDEMIRYVYWGENIYRDAKEGLANSPYLIEWLGSGGAKLCAQAGRHISLGD